jgi:hypothetical protein
MTSNTYPKLLSTNRSFVTDIFGWLEGQRSGISGEVPFYGTSPFDLVTYGLELGLIPTVPLVFQPVSGQQANHHIGSTDVPRSFGGSSPRE